MPARDLVRSLRAGRFLAATLVVNFVVVPLVVAAMFGFLPADRAVQVGVLLVLLTPCVDYVIVFSGPARGSSDRLPAATPLLLIAQMRLCLRQGSDPIRPSSTASPRILESRVTTSATQRSPSDRRSCLARS
ncbi:hypothetical protein [Saccharothrix sp. NRRL B-16314]|uniref:hypothetical protein n=1 Tax=Saccharothrix sp. NRRL B-16314 TaxID=1463825 RepID=UPI000A91D39D